MAHTSHEILVEKVNQAKKRVRAQLVIDEKTENLMFIDSSFNVMVPYTVLSPVDGAKNFDPGVVDSDKIKELLTAEIRIPAGSRYQHTKTGGIYSVVGVGLNTVNNEPSIIYQEESYNPPLTWSRSYSGEEGWIVPTDIDGLPSPRFTRII